MFPNVFYLLVPASLLVASAVCIVLWDRAGKKANADQKAEGETEGAFRSFYHALWVLMLWGGLCLSLPLWVSYQEKIHADSLPVKFGVMFRVLALPLVLLVLLWYGGRQGYLKWIDGLSWPDGGSGGRGGADGDRR